MADPFQEELERRKVTSTAAPPTATVTSDPFAAELAKRKAGAGSATPAQGQASPGAGPAPPQSLLGGFYQGFSRGVKSDAALFKGAIGTGLSAVGIDHGEQLLDDAIADLHRAETTAPRAVPSYKDVDGVHDALMYASETLGEQIPTIATVLLGGGVGGAVAKGVASAAAKKGIAEAGAKALARKGFAAGATGTAIGLETGGSAAEIKGATGESAPLTSIGAGIVKGGLEVLTPLGLAKTIGLMPSAAKGLSGVIAKAMTGSTAGRIAKGAAATAAAESGTEALQESVDVAIRGWVDQNYDSLGAEAAERILNAGLSGAIAGGAFGGATSAVAGEVAPDTPVTMEQLREGLQKPKAQPFEVTEESRAGPMEGKTFEVASIKAGAGMVESGQGPVSARNIEGPERTYLTGSTKTSAPEPENQNTATPGSHVRDAELGFEVLPTAYRDIPARDEGDLQRASIELAIRGLTSERETLQKESKKGAAAPQSARLERVKETLKALVEAGATASMRRVPTIVTGVGQGPRLVSDPETLAASTATLVPRGYSLLPIDGGDFINLKAPNGRTVIQVPNQQWVGATLRAVAQADQELDTAEFYSKAASNITKFRALTPEQIDLRTVEIIPATVAKSAQLVKKLGLFRIPEAANRNIIPAKDPPPGLTVNSIEADAIKFTWWMGKWNTLIQIVQRNAKYKPLTDYLDRFLVHHAEKMKVINRGEEIVHRLQRVGKEQADAAAKFLWWMEQQEYLSDADKAHNRDNPDSLIERWPTEAEERAAIAEFGLRGETFEILTAIRNNERWRFDLHIQEVVKQALKLPTAQARSTQLARLEKYKQDYFRRPRFRFAQVGNKTVEVYDAEGTLIEAQQFESASEQAVAFREAQRNHPNLNVRQSTIPEIIKQWVTTPDLVLDQLISSGYLSGLSKGQKDLALMLSRGGPNLKRRFVHSADPRRGMGTDLLRAFAQGVMGDANNLFRMKIGPPLQRILAQMEKDREAGTDTNNLGKMIDFLKKHMEESIDPKDSGSKMRALAFTWWLAWVPASAVINASQVPITTFPYLGTRFGNARAGAALMKAYAEKDTYWKSGKDGNSNLDNKFISKGLEDGVLNESQAANMAGLGEGSNLQRMMGTTKLDRTLKQFAYYGSFMFQTVEQINRIVTFKAATRLAMSKPNTKYLTDLQNENSDRFVQLKSEGFSEAEARAYLAGTDAVRRTQFEYNEWNRPRFMKGKVGGTMFTFWMFTQGMLNFGRRSPGAMKFWFIMLAVGGLMGLPGANDLKEIIKAASQWWFGKDFDVEREAREFITLMVNPYLPEKVGETDVRQYTADLFLHGLSRDSFGISIIGDALGVPHIPHIDLSGSLSMGRLLPVDPTVLKPGMKWSERVSRTVERLGGAAMGPAFGMMQALQDQSLPGDDFKMWERAMPRIVKSFLRAGRLSAEGKERSRTGATIEDFDPMSPRDNLELIAMSMGFQSTQLSKKWDKLIATREFENFLDLRRGIILRQLDHAIHMKDPDGRADMMKAVQRYNKDVGEFAPNKRISADTIRRSMKERARRRAEQTAGKSRTKGSAQIQEMMNKLYPEVPD